METKNIDYTDDKLIAVLHNDNSKYITVEKDGKLLEVEAMEIASKEADEILAFLGRDLKTMILNEAENPNFVNDYAMARLIIFFKELLTSSAKLCVALSETIEELKKNNNNKEA